MDKKVSTRACCVVDCKNTERKNPELQFHRFPGYPHELERKKKWIAAVRRETSDGKPWQPGKNSRICSAHFVGGEKSNNPLNESYHPTIFPPIYGKKRNSNAGLRAERLRKRRERISSAIINTAPTDAAVDETVVSEKHDIGIQTDPDFELNNDCNDINIMFCWSNYNETATQTNIFVHSGLNNNSKIVNPQKSRIIF